MDSRYKLLLTVICACGLMAISVEAHAQDCGDKKSKPTWASSSYTRTLSNSYLEVVVMSGRDEQGIIDDAQAEIKRRRRLKVGEENAWIKSGYIASFWECNTNGTKTGYFLYQTPKNPSMQYSDIEALVASDKYPFSARVFVPGWAQFHKGQSGRGAFFITSEVLFIGGIVATQSLKSYYKAQIASTYNSALKNRFATNANVCNIAGYVAIAGAIGLYLGNIIDGCVSRGRPNVFIDKNGKMRELSLMPYASPASTGLALNLKF